MKRVIDLLKKEKKEVYEQYEACRKKLWSWGKSEELEEYSGDLAKAISILNGEIRESCGEFCHCVHVGMHLYGEKCNHCDLPISPQNYQERT